MIVHVNPPNNYKKPKVKVFKPNEVRKCAEFLLELKDSNRVFKIYKRDRQKEIYYAVHY